MSEFQWTDELVKEFVDEFFPVFEKVDKNQHIARFKASKQPKQEWEILEGKSDKGYVFRWMKNDMNFMDDVVGPKSSIYSVKRLSDGEVFTVGDSVDIFNCLARHTIIEFKIDDRNKMLAKFDDFPSYDIMLLRRKYSNSFSDKPIPVYLTHSEIERLRTILATH